MQKQELIEYITTPGLWNEQTLKQIRELLTEYPFFNTAHLLYLQKMLLAEPDKFSYYIKLSNIHINDSRKISSIIELTENLKNREEVSDFMPTTPDIHHTPDEQFTSSEIVNENINDNDKETVVDTTEEMEEEIVQKNTVDGQEEEKTDTTFGLSDVQKKSEDAIENLKTNLQRKNKSNNLRSNISSLLEDQIKLSNEKDNLDEIIEHNTEYLVNPLFSSNLSDEELLMIDPNDNIKKTYNIKFIPETSDEKISDDDLFALDKENDSNDSTLDTTIPENEEKNEIMDEKSEVVKEVKQKKIELIEAFIKDDSDKKIRVSDNMKEIDYAEKSNHEDEQIMTETLANIYVNQKKILKAIAVYEKLSLKYPEKNVYFAAKIEELKKLITE